MFGRDKRNGGRKVVMIRNSKGEKIIWLPGKQGRRSKRQPAQQQEEEDQQHDRFLFPDGKAQQ
jgi:hypothetical protein